MVEFTRQAFYSFFRTESIEAIQKEIIIQEVARIRVIMPQIGTRKLFFLINDFFDKHRFKIDRDAFFDILREYQLLLRKRKSRKPKIINSLLYLRKYLSLIIELVVDRPNLIWVSDITYIDVGNDFSYLFLITDAYSRKIIGYSIEESLATIAASKASKMAIKQKN